MINITVYRHDYVELEEQQYEILTQEDMIVFLHTLINKIKYGGEKVCLETANVFEDKVSFTDIDRW